MQYMCLRQETGLDTVDANRALGLPDDCREYTSVTNILADLGIKSIMLMVRSHHWPHACKSHLTNVGVGATGFMVAHCSDCTYTCHLTHVCASYYILITCTCVMPKQTAQELTCVCCRQIIRAR